MKRLLPILLFPILLLAQQQVQIVSGVLTLNLSPGNNSFKVIIGQNITSVVITNPTPGTLVTVNFAENATGGFTVAFGGNISNPCTVTTSANAVTICQFQYDASSNTWNGISGGGGGGLTQVATLPATCAAGTQYQLPGGAVYSCGPTNILTSDVTNAVAGLPDPSHILALNLMLDGSGNASDSSGNSNICTLAAAGAAPTWNTAASGGGLNFAAASSQFCSYPAAMNSALTFVVAMSFQPGILTPVLGTTSNFANYDLRSIIGSSAGLVTWGIRNATVADSFKTAAVQGAYSPINWNSTVGFTDSGECVFNGVAVAAMVMGAQDTFYLNGQPCLLFSGGVTSAGKQTSGVFQLGYPANAAFNYFQGTVYAVAAWSTALTTAQVAQASQSLQQLLMQRGIQQFLNGGIVGGGSLATQDHNDVVVFEGDSLFNGTPTGGGLVGAPYYVANNSISGGGTFTILNRFALWDAPIVRPVANRNVFIEWAGTNECGATSPPQILANYQGTARMAKSLGFKTIFATMMSRTTQDACKDALNPLERQYMPLYADAILDFAANVHMGADGANTNTTYFNVDGIHLTAFSATNIISHYAANAINRVTGNLLGAVNYNVYAGTGNTIPTLKQTVDCSSSGASETCILPWNTTTGNFLFLNVNCNSCTGVTVINVPTDSQTNTWNAVTATTAYNGSIGFTRSFYAMNITGGATTITITFTGTAPGNTVMTAQEFSGVLTAAALDINSVVASGNSASPASANVTTTVTGDLLIGSGQGPGNQTGANTPIGQFWTATVPLVATSPPQQGAETLWTVTGAAGSYPTSATLAQSAPWGMMAVAFKPVTASTSTFQLQDVDVYAECNPAGGNTALILPDGVFVLGSMNGTVTIKNIQSAGANTCVVNAPTPYETGVQQTIDGATSVTIANKATAVFRAKLTFSGTPPTTQSPIVTWELLQNN